MRKTKKQKSQQTVKPDSISLEEIKEFAYQNFVNEDREQFSVPINGIAVTSPWMDQSARFELTTQEAIQEWGAEGFNRFCDEARKYLAEHKSH